jgi:hypothetical protein
MLDRLLGKTSEEMETQADPPSLQGGQVNRVVTGHVAENTFCRSSSPPSPTSPTPDLDSRTLAEHFGLELPPYATTETINGLLAAAMLDGRIAPKAITDLHAEVWAAVGALEWEIGTGLVSRKPRLVGGRPLADWLTLDDVARLLREGGR